MSSRPLPLVLAGGGWLVLGGLGVLSALSAVLQLVVAQVRLATEPVPRFFSFGAELVAVSWGIALVSLASSVLVTCAAAVLLSRPRRWARRTLEVVSWLGMLGFLVLAAWFGGTFGLSGIGAFLGVLLILASTMGVSVLLLRSEGVHRVVEAAEMERRAERAHDGS